MFQNDEQKEKFRAELEQWVKKTYDRPGAGG